MSRALGQSPEDAAADGIHKLTPHLTGNVALLFTSRPQAEVTSYFGSFAPVDFARAGAVAPRDFVIPSGVLYATGGAVPAEHDVPLGHTIEPELRRLGVPTRMVRGKVVLGEEGGGGEGYTVCKEGQVLDSRQTRLLKLFDQCLSEFRVKILAWVFPGFSPPTWVHACGVHGLLTSTGLSATGRPRVGSSPRSRRLTRTPWMASMRMMSRAVRDTTSRERS